MTLVKETTVPILGLSVAAAALAIGTLAQPMSADVTCETIPCTFYWAGGSATGQCGVDGDHCACRYQGEPQAQTACC